MPKYIELLGDAIRIGIQAIGTVTRYVGLTSDGPVLEVRGGVVVQAELAQGKLAGRYSSGAGEIQPITPSGGLAIDGSGNLTYSGGISDHDDLGNLDWDLSGHVGDADKIASFNSSSDAAYLSIGPGLTVSGSTLQSASPWKAVARLATTAAGTLATDFDNGSTVDGVTLVTGDRILLKDQSPSDDNGLYTVNASGAPTRTADASTAALSQGLAVWIAEGSVNAHTVWVIDSDPVAAGNYRFKGLVKSGSSDIGFLAKNGSTAAQARTLTVGPCLAVTNPTGAAGDPAIVLDTAIRVCGRLTLESGVPISTSNQTGKTSVYFTPYAGDSVPIHDGTRFVNRVFTEISIAVPSTRFRLADVFAYYTGSAVALETTNWNQSTATINAFNAGTQTFTTSSAHGLAEYDTIGIADIVGTVGTDSTYGVNGRLWSVASVPTSTTFTLRGITLSSFAYTSGGTLYTVPNTRATALTTLNGIDVKNGDNTRTYLGTVMTTGVTGQTEMNQGYTEAKLLLWNRYNQGNFRGQTVMGSSHTYTSATWRFWDNNPGNRIVVVVGQALVAKATIGTKAYGGDGKISFGFNGTMNAGAALENGSPYYSANAMAWDPKIPAGAHFISSSEYGAAGFTTTYADLYITVPM